jgi:hypothetical protein
MGLQDSSGFFHRWSLLSRVIASPVISSRVISSRVISSRVIAGHFVAGLLRRVPQKLVNPIAELL